MSALERFARWLEKDRNERINGVNVSLLEIAEGLDKGGRGLVSKVAISAGSCCFSVPISDPCLILTPHRCVEYLNRCNCFKNNPPVASTRTLEPLNCLVLFLYHISLTDCCPLKQIWEPYLHVLPKTYSDPVSASYIFPDQFPAAFNITDLNSHFQKVHKRLLRSWDQIQQVITGDSDSRQEPPEQFVWAWFSINSRCVYCPLTKFDQDTQLRFVDNLGLDKSTSPIFSVHHAPRESSVDVALIPFFDFFNHSASVRCQLIINDSENSVQLFLDQPISAGEQVFINYGSHDNLNLLLEYGFSFGPGENPFDAVYPCSTDLESVTQTSFYNHVHTVVAYMGVKESVGQDNSTVWPTICCTRAGPSLHLLLLLHVLTVLRTEEVNNETILPYFDVQKLYELDEDFLLQRLRPILVRLINRLVQQQRSDHLMVTNRLKLVTSEERIAVVDSLHALRHFLLTREKLLEEIQDVLRD
ncbi:hypothetical protein FGIG_08840 [Fasciola gigantica]|uniref:SET domain-containing protein n=1 Tax=Fasciola gigantica TaxID=46835 RepID=A0A504Y6F0_FASGI|nr:hypothetical protein FGIG_08840 [Fasciola gigantica]